MKRWSLDARSGGSLEAALQLEKIDIEGSDEALMA